MMRSKAMKSSESDGITRPFLSLLRKKHVGGSQESLNLTATTGASLPWAARLGQRYHNPPDGDWYKLSSVSTTSVPHLQSIAFAVSRRQSVSGTRPALTTTLPHLGHAHSAGAEFTKVA